ncbi:MAG: transporter substrate-binding domain-containing protein [Victivallaceae bacterium]
MGKRILFVCFFVMSFMTLSCFLSCVSSKQGIGQSVLTVGTNATYPPYEYVNEKGLVEGFDIDLAEAIGKKLNKQVVIKEFGFDCLILNVKKGKIDMAIAGMSITPERQKEVAMIPYQGDTMKELAVIFWKNVPNDNPSSLSQYPSIAVQVSTFQERFVTEAVAGSKNTNVKSFDSTVELVMEIKYGKSAVAVMEPTVARLMQEKFPDLKIVTIPIPEDQWTLGNGIVVAKNNVALIKAIEKALEELNLEGVIANLEKKWGLSVAV